MSAVAFGGGREPGQALRWTAAALLVAGVHAAAGWWLAGHAFARPTTPEGTAGVTVELDPVSVPLPPTAEPKPMETAGPAPEPQVAEAPEGRPDAPPPVAEPAPQVSTAEPPAPEPQPVEAAAASPPEPVPTVPQQTPESVSPPPAIAPAPSDAVLAPPPPPRPVVPPKKVAKPPRPVPPKPDPREVARQEAREAQREAREDARREARAQAAAEARAQRQAAREARATQAAATREGGGADVASAAPRASGASVASWRGEVAAHLNAYKPASPDGSDGTVGVAFSVDRGGRVVSAAVSRSSGDPALDQAAVSMVRRASPVPAPPPEMGGRVSLAVPVHFH